MALATNGPPGGTRRYRRFGRWTHRRQPRQRRQLNSARHRRSSQRQRQRHCRRVNNRRTAPVALATNGPSGGTRRYRRRGRWTRSRRHRQQRRHRGQQQRRKASRTVEGNRQGSPRSRRRTNQALRPWRVAVTVRMRHRRRRIRQPSPRAPRQQQRRRPSAFGCCHRQQHRADVPDP